MSDEGILKVLIRRSTLANFIACILVITGVCYFIVTGDGETIKTLTLIGAGALFKTVIDSKNKTR